MRKHLFTALVARMGAQGVALTASTPEELAAIARRDTDKWAKVIRDAKITLE